MSIDLSLIFGFLYPIVPIIAVGGYCPQLYAAFKSSTRMDSISLTTWSIWLFAWSVAFGYSAITIADAMLTFTAAVNILCHVLLIGMIVYKRRCYDLKLNSRTVFEIDTRVNPDISQIPYQMHDERYERVEIERAQDNWIVPVDNAFIAEQAKAIERENNLNQ